MKTSMTLIQVVEFYEEKVVEMCQNEINEDFCCKNGMPSKVMRYGGILSHATKVYAITLFKMFEEEFNSSGGLSCVETNHHENNFTYSLHNEISSRVYIVHFNRSEFTICYECKLFEILGLLCCLALRVFIVNNVNKIPDTYISIRWTKDAKKRLCYYDDFSQPKKKSSRTLRMSMLTHLGYNMFDKASLTDNGTKFIMDNLRELSREFEKYMMATNGVEDVGKECPQDLAHDEVQPNLDGEKPILDLPHVRKKGITNARIKCQLEKKKRKKGERCFNFTSSTIYFYASRNSSEKDEKKHERCNLFPSSTS